MTPLTPARRLAGEIERRAIETQLISKLIDVGDYILGQAHIREPEAWERQRDDVHAVLHGARAMLGDLVEELGKLEDRALALQEASPTGGGGHVPVGR